MQSTSDLTTACHSHSIPRQLGSGGLEIGRLLAERLNLAFYDKELLTEAARHSGICPECFQQVDEQAKRTFGGVGIFGMRFPFVGDGNTSYNSMISGDNLFLIQSETIVKLAENEQGAFCRPAKVFCKGCWRYQK